MYTYFQAFGIPVIMVIVSMIIGFLSKCFPRKIFLGPLIPQCLIVIGLVTQDKNCLDCFLLLGLADLSAIWARIHHFKVPYLDDLASCLEYAR